MRSIFLTASLVVLVIAIAAVRGDEKKQVAKETAIWPQWRGPNRDGRVAGPAWPERMTEESLKLLWRVPLGPSYSGPIVSEDLVFTAETKNKETEVVFALDRQTGKERWRAEWKGAMTVPFFAAANGSWIRATPAYDGESLYVAGIRDVLVCLDAKSGKERWRVDFVNEFKAELPAFGCVCSPLVDGDFVYIQAGASVAKLDKKTGKVLWRSLKDAGGMNGSAFSSPVIATLAGQRQLLVQGREKLAGIDLTSGEVLWSQIVPSFRGMNILTPTVVDDAIFTSSYSNNSWLYKVAKIKDKFAVEQAWTNKATGYMSSPVVVDGHAYLHLQNRRFTCINLKTGAQTWTTEPFGQYWSMVAQGDQILALDQSGSLFLIKANPKQFELLDTRKISRADTWAHLAVCGDELFVRELNALAVYRWQLPKKGD
jgi:outer membrane protein assembly factor BamB